MVWKQRFLNRWEFLCRPATAPEEGDLGVAASLPIPVSWPPRLLRYKEETVEETSDLDTEETEESPPSIKFRMDGKSFKTYRELSQFFDKRATNQIDQGES